MSGSPRRRHTQLEFLACDGKEATLDSQQNRWFCEGAKSRNVVPKAIAPLNPDFTFMYGSQAELKMNTSALIGDRKSSRLHKVRPDYSSEERIESKVNAPKLSQSDATKAAQQQSQRRKGWTPMSTSSMKKRVPMDQGPKSSMPHFMSETSVIEPFVTENYGMSGGFLKMKVLDNELPVCFRSTTQHQKQYFFGGEAEDTDALPLQYVCCDGVNSLGPHPMQNETSYGFIVECASCGLGLHNSCMGWSEDMYGWVKEYDCPRCGVVKEEADSKEDEEARGPPPKSMQTPVKKKDPVQATEEEKDAAIEEKIKEEADLDENPERRCAICGEVTDELLFHLDCSNCSYKRKESIHYECESSLSKWMEDGMVCPECKQDDLELHVDNKDSPSA